MQIFLRLFVGVKYFNKEVLKKHKQFIIISNHNSHLDTLALMAVIPFRHLVNTHPVASIEYFGKTPLRAFITRLLTNAILIPNTITGREPDSINMMKECLKNGQSLIFFPEGSRGEPEKMSEFKKGIGNIIKSNPNIPCIPVFIKGLGKVLPKGKILFVPFDSYVVFGETEFYQSGNPESITLQIENEVKNLSKKVSVI